MNAITQAVPAATRRADSLPRTLVELGGSKARPARLSDSVLIIIDAQREYVDGMLPLVGVADAIAETSRLLERARAARTPVVHVVHRGGGRLFNHATAGFEIVAALAPAPHETVIEKLRTSSFAGTRLEDVLHRTGRKNLLIAGFMTHHCVSSTARAGRDLGYEPTVVAKATATRDLPDGRGGVIPAAAIQAAALAALGDKTAGVVEAAADIGE